jgi:hypothetical protein
MVRSLVSFVMLLGIVLGAVAYVIRNPDLRDQILPASATGFLREKGALAALGAPDGDVLIGATPQDFLIETSGGLVADGPIAAAGGSQPVFIKDVLSGHSADPGSDIPAEITTIRPILGCQLTRPLGGTVIGHVTSTSSPLKLALTTSSDSDLAAAVQDYVDAYRKFGAGARLPASGPRYQSHDVAVTETAAPVYLVLENLAGNRIWNIHLADGVQIERVVLLGGNQSGVANLDPVVPVEVILAEGLAECGIDPAYVPGPSPISGVQPTPDAATRSRADAYDIWFRDTFDVLAGESRLGFAEGAVTLVGPVPSGSESKAVYVSIKGARVRTTQGPFFEIRGQVAAGQDFAARVLMIATGFAFGDLDRLLQGGTF